MWNYQRWTWHRKGENYPAVKEWSSNWCVQEEDRRDGYAEVRFKRVIRQEPEVVRQDWNFGKRERK